MEDIVDQIVQKERISSERIEKAREKYSEKVEQYRNEMEDFKSDEKKKILEQSRKEIDEAERIAKEEVDRELEKIQSMKDELDNNADLKAGIAREVLSFILS